MKKSLIFVGMLAIGFANAQDYDGKVGINTGTPSATLNVKTKTDATSPKNLELENQTGTKLVTVLNRGNMGINIDTPTEKLHINEGNLKIVRTSEGAGPFLELNNPSKSGDLQANYWRLYNATGAYGDVLLFYPYNSKNVGLHSSAAFSFTDDAKFGIGLNKPQEKLHVSTGNVRINDLPSNTGETADKVVVVDNTGVLKSIDRSSFGTAEVGGEWVYDDTTKRINLKRSGSGEFKNKVFYDSHTGQYINIDDEKNIRYSELVSKSNSIDTVEKVKSLDETERYRSFTHTETKNMPLSIATNHDGSKSNYKRISSANMVVSSEDNTPPIFKEISIIF